MSATDLPVVGGGTANTAFLSGSSTAGPNAVTALVSATFWLETVQGPPESMQLQYSQMVVLNFNGISWPHVTVGTSDRCLLVLALRPTDAAGGLLLLGG